MKKQKEDKIAIEIDKSALKFFLSGLLAASIIFVLYLWYKGELSKISSTGQKPTTTQATTSETCNDEESIKRVKQSVVKIIGDKSSGSGFVVSKDGFIVTNYHVIQDEEKSHVVFANGSSDIAKVYNYDAKVDIALLKTTPQNDIQPLEWSDLKSLNPGATVIAIGYPYSDALKGEATVTKGTFSANRETDDGVIKYIQTDTSLNHGNSGGPLIDSCGKVVGINEIAISTTDGINLAISSATAKNYAETLAKEEKPQTQLAGDTTVTPQDAVGLFYILVSARRLDDAFSILSPDYQATININDWHNGYSSSLNTFVNDVRLVGSDEFGYEAVYVNLTSVDLVGDKVQSRNFEGVWHLIQINGLWRMDHGPIREIK